MMICGRALLIAVFDGRTLRPSAANITIAASIAVAAIASAASTTIAATTVAAAVATKSCKRRFQFSAIKSAIFIGITTANTLPHAFGKFVFA